MLGYGKELVRPMNDEKQVDDAGLEWEKRVLCGDESCIGVIGPDGRCKECGRPFEGPLPQSQGPAGPEAADEVSREQNPVTHETPGSVESDVSSEEQSEASSSMNDEWERRTLCADESCIGVIGRDGRCKECGKPYPPQD